MSASPDLPWKVRLFVAANTFAFDFSIRSDGTLNRRILNLFDFKVSPSTKPTNGITNWFRLFNSRFFTPSTKPTNGVTTSDVTVDPSRNLWFRLFTPSTANDEDNASLPVIIYFHGGGFVFLGANSKIYEDFCRRLAKELPAVIVSVNYRLSPEHRLPCQYDDGLDVLKFIDNREFAEFPKNADLKRCFLAGDSAGGNIAHNVCVRACEYEFKEVKVMGVIAIQPYFGGEERTKSEEDLVGAPFVSTERTDWVWKVYVPDGSDRDHPDVNVFGPKSRDISGLEFPSTLVFVGGYDPLKDWQKRYVEGLKRSGKEAELIEYPNAIHSFYAFPEFPESGLLVEEVQLFIQQRD